MTTLKIYEYPEKVLLTRADEVEQFDQDLAKFVDDMHETMLAANGIGLAANQVGVLKRVLIIYIPWQESRYSEQEELKEDWHNIKYTFINPVIISKKGKFKYQEGCLSFPEIFDFVERSEHIVVRAQDVNGGFFEVEANGLFSVCLQHEIDHLDGIVFIDRMSRLKSQIIKKKIQKRQREDLYLKEEEEIV